MYTARDDLESLAYTLVSLRRLIPIPAWLIQTMLWIDYGPESLPVGRKIKISREDLLDDFMDGVEPPYREFLQSSQSLPPNSPIDCSGWSGRFHELYRECVGGSNLE